MGWGRTKTSTSSGSERKENESRAGKSGQGKGGKMVAGENSQAMIEWQKTSHETSLKRKVPQWSAQTEGKVSLGQNPGRKGQVYRRHAREGSAWRGSRWKTKWLFY